MTTKAKREIYARLGVQLRGNRRAFKAERLAPGAMGLYAFMVMDARAELPEVDGFVAEEVVLSAWGRPVTERLAQVEALCEVDLVERAPGGFVVVKYDEHNDCRETVEKNKKATRLRVKKHRKDVTRYTAVTEPVCNAFVPISSSLSNSGSSGSSLASVRVLGPDGDSGTAFGAWQAGIRSVTGKPVSRLSPSEQRDVVDLANGHAEGRQGEALMAWIAETAEVWARQHDPRFGGFKPMHCKTWLDSGRPARGPVARGAEITKQPYDPEAPWMKLPEVG